MSKSFRKYVPKQVYGEMIQFLRSNFHNCFYKLEPKFPPNLENEQLIEIKFLSSKHFNFFMLMFSNK